MVFRFYNASLINYDDLVGIPLPDETQTSLRYITTPTAIWDAEVVFVDADIAKIVRDVYRTAGYGGSWTPTQRRSG